MIEGIVIGLLALILLSLIATLLRHRSLRADLRSSVSSLNEVVDYQSQQLQQLKQQLSSYEQKLTHAEQVRASDQKVLQQLQFNQQQQLTIIEEMSNKLLLLEQQQDPNPLYTRAKKMIELGADMDEVIQECELSHAEAELLIAMQKQNKTA